MRFCANVRECVDHHYEYEVNQAFVDKFNEMMRSDEYVRDGESIHVFTLEECEDFIRTYFSHNRYYDDYCDPWYDGHYDLPNFWFESYEGYYTSPADAFMGFLFEETDMMPPTKEWSSEPTYDDETFYYFKNDDDIG